ncbi:MAG TPA: hypothetical protein VMX33_06565 [bacterium]|jgi:hypothetical protein|nr:hypothetical protein [bacterium]
MDDTNLTDVGAVRQAGMRGVVSTGAGIGLILFNTMLHIPVVGYVIGGALIVLGVMGLVGKNRTDKSTGAVLIGAGVLGLASFLLKGITGFVLGAGGLGLIGYGIYNLFKFARGLKSRS